MVGSYMYGQGVANATENLPLQTKLFTLIISITISSNLIDQ